MDYIIMVLLSPLVLCLYFILIKGEKDAEKRKKTEAQKNEEKYKEKMIADGYININGMWILKNDTINDRYMLAKIYEKHPGITRGEANKLLDEKREYDARCRAEYIRKKELEYQAKKEKELQEFEECKSKAENGDPIEQYNLAIYYWNGGIVEKDYEKAIEYFTLAANQGDADAQYELADCYFNNDGVKYRDYDIAFEYYLKAAEQGHIEAEYMVGLCYEEGKGIQRDFQKAGDWYKKSADNDYELAYESLDRLYTAGKWNKNHSEIKASGKTIEKDIEGVYNNFSKVEKFMESEDYEEAAVNIRHVLEKTLKYYIEKYSPENVYDDVYTKINLLSQKNILNEHTSNIYHKLRIISNKGAHVNDNKLSQNDIREALAPLKEIIEFYVND